MPYGRSVEGQRVFRESGEMKVSEEVLGVMGLHLLLVEMRWKRSHSQKNE